MDSGAGRPERVYGATGLRDRRSAKAASGVGFRVGAEWSRASLIAPVDEPYNVDDGLRVASPLQWWDEL